MLSAARVCRPASLLSAGRRLSDAATVFASPRPAVDIPDGLSLGQFVLDSAEQWGDATYLVDGITGEEMTFARFAEDVRKAAGGLAKLGLRAGDTLGLAATNGLDYPVAMFAAIALGAKVTTCNPAYTASELAYQFRNSSTSIVVTVPEYADKVVQAAEQTDTQTVLSLGDGDSVGLRPWAEVLDSAAADLSKVSVAPASDVALLPYSSGTTGLPKGVMLSHANIISNVLQTYEPSSLSVGSEDTIVGVLPWFHIYGMVVVQMAPLVTGCRCVTLPSFSPDSFLSAMDSYSVTKAHLVPPIISFLAKHTLVDDYDLSALQWIMSAAAPLGSELSTALVDRLGGTLSVRQGYGLSELSPISHIAPLTGAHAASCGQLVSNSEGKLVDVSTGEALPRGQEGEVCVRGPQVMLGYLNNAEATAETIDDDGWLHTGDIGYIDDDDMWYIVDRAKELIKVKGLQVAPAELEALLMSHDAVAMAAVIGVPDDRAGELPKAFVTLKDGHSASEQELKSLVSDTLSSHKHLTAVEFTDDIPISASGKILRRELRDREAK